MRAAVYSATRNLYPMLLPSVKSLLHNSDVERIYLLIEDDAFPGELPAACEVFNVSGQTWFPPGGPNYGSCWTYMVLLRAAYTKIFPRLDRILSMDYDAIVLRDISHLWDLNLDGYCLAAVYEPEKSKKYGPYINAGVMMMHLDQLRVNQLDDTLIRALNKNYYSFPEQHALSLACRGMIYELNASYNAGNGTGIPDNPHIRHYMGERPLERFEPFRRYRDMPMEEVRPCRW